VRGRRSGTQSTGRLVERRACRTHMTSPTSPAYYAEHARRRRRPDAPSADISHMRHCTCFLFAPVARPHAAQPRERASRTTTGSPPPPPPPPPQLVRPPASGGAVVWAERSFSRRHPKCSWDILDCATNKDKKKLRHEQGLTQNAEEPRQRGVGCMGSSAARRRDDAGARWRPCYACPRAHARARARTRARADAQGRPGCACVAHCTGVRGGNGLDLQRRAGGYVVPRAHAQVFCGVCYLLSRKYCSGVPGQRRRETRSRKRASRAPLRSVHAVPRPYMYVCMHVCM